LLKEKQPELYEHFQEHDIMVEMYASDWVFCLFASLIPVHIWPDFFDLFLRLDWSFFYGICLSLLTFFKQKLLEEDDISGILYHIKFKNTPEKSGQ
jgi:hypothetical protein